MPLVVDRGSIWIVDLGMAAKVRPCLILSVPTDPQDLTFRDPDTFEMRNAENRHGGVWRRVPPTP